VGFASHAFSAGDGGHHRKIARTTVPITTGAPYEVLAGVGPIDRAQLVEAVGEGAACQRAEDGCLGLVGQPDEVLGGVVGDQALPGPIPAGGPQRLVADGREAPNGAFLEAPDTVVPW
jgi:hypothetical protein